MNLNCYRKNTDNSLKVNHNKAWKDQLDIESILCTPNVSKGTSSRTMHMKLHSVCIGKPNEQTFITTFNNTNLKSDTDCSYS